MDLDYGLLLYSYIDRTEWEVLVLLSSVVLLYFVINVVITQFYFLSRKKRMSSYSQERFRM
jgi:hypothetical protein